MSPEITITDQVELALAKVEGRNPKPKFHVRTETEKSQKVTGANGEILEINMDGVNANRLTQHLVLTGDIIGGRHSVVLDNIRGTASEVLATGDLLEVDAPSAVIRREKPTSVRPEVTRVERTLRDLAAPIPSFGDVYVEG